MPTGTFTLTFNGQTTGQFVSVDVLQADSSFRSTGGLKWETDALKQNPGGKWETGALKRNPGGKWETGALKQNPGGKWETGALKQNPGGKWETGALKQNVEAGDATPLVLHGFRSADPAWNPTAENGKGGELVLWNALGKVSARYSFSQAWASANTYTGATTVNQGDLLLMVRGLRRADG